MEIRIDDYNGRIHVSNIFHEFFPVTQEELENILCAVKMCQKKHPTIIHC